MSAHAALGESERPLVSVLTPSFNQGRFIGDCLESVRRQTYPNVEHIVCDGGSDDGTLEVLQAAPPTVSWISEPDRGQSDAINKALGMSRGAIIGWINSDDAYFDAEAIESAVDLFTRRPEVDVVYGHAALVSADGLVLHLMWVPPFSYSFLRRANFIVQPSVFMRRSALGDRVVEPAYDHSMDRELWLRLGATHRFARVDRILAIDRHHGARKVYTRQDLAEQDLRRLVATYGIPENAPLRVARKLYKLGARLAGARLVPRAQVPLAFGGRVDHPTRLLLRQVALLRRAMPFESAPRAQ